MTTTNKPQACIGGLDSATSWTTTRKHSTMPERFTTEQAILYWTHMAAGSSGAHRTQALERVERLRARLADASE
ncbi:hypothetical protein FHS85_001871 [Rhodoligotrophos appendicifer]|uniref:hypothetical protein n=1 Tax=Rhodoligotrophos appendicifer TaxID=987056 RepID=UPI001961837C|nr:hypothetical protein [Rhodoligotrophos appendicifer]